MQKFIFAFFIFTSSFINSNLISANPSCTEECISDAIEGARQSHVCKWAKNKCWPPVQEMLDKHCKNGIMDDYRDLFEGYTDEEYSQLSQDEKDGIASRLFCTQGRSIYPLSLYRNTVENSSYYRQWLSSVKTRCRTNCALSRIP